MVRLTTAGPGSHLRIHPLLAAVVAAAVLFVVWKIRSILLLLFAGSIGALLLSGAVNQAQQWLHIRRGFAYITVLFTIGSTLGLIVFLGGPVILQQFSALRLDIPTAAHRISSLIGNNEWGQWIATQVLDPAQLSKGFALALAGLGGAITTTASIVGGAFIVLFVSLYLAGEPDLYRRGLIRITPEPFRVTLLTCLDRAIHNLRYWILAKSISMCAIGTLVTVGLWWLHIPLAPTLGAFAALMTFIPNFGPLLSVVPAALLAFAASPAKGIGTIVLFAAAHFLEGNLVTPLAERNIVKLPPVLTLTNQLVLASLTGFAGVALAAPLTAVMLGVGQVLLPPVERPANQSQITCDKTSDTAVQT